MQFADDLTLFIHITAADPGNAAVGFDQLPYLTDCFFIHYIDLNLTFHGRKGPRSPAGLYILAAHRPKNRCVSGKNHYTTYFGVSPVGD